MGSLKHKIAKRMAVLLYRLMCVFFPVKEQRVVFDSNVAKSYAGNPKYIYEQLVKNGYDKKWNLIWFYESEPYDIPGKHRQVKYAGLEYLKMMATAKVWVFDSRQPEFLKKRDGQFYIQTWHGTPLKKLGLDLDEVFMSDGQNLSEYKEKFAKNAHTWDYLISQNPFSTEIFERCFDFKGRFLQIGYPRNDILIRESLGEDPEDVKNKYREKLGIPTDKMVLLYAPTWRDDEFSGNHMYEFKPKLSFDRLKEELSGEFVIIVKYHYLIMDSVDWSPYEGFIYTFDQSEDIADLYLASDALITDYSSVMFDFSLLGRPMFFYAYDLDKYRDSLRGFYFDYEEWMPGPVAKTTDELIAKITGYEPELYEEKYERFVERFNPFDDGFASEKVIELMGKMIPSEPGTFLGIRPGRGPGGMQRGGGDGE